MRSMNSNSQKTKKRFAVAVCGLSTVDIVVHPVDLKRPLGEDGLRHVDPIVLTTGGIVSNAGIAFAKLGQTTAAVSAIGDDEWGEFLIRKYSEAGIDTSQITTLPNTPSSSTVVLVDESGSRSFLHCAGAPQLLTKDYFLSRLPFFSECQSMLFGYYSLFPALEPDLPEIFQAIRSVGCMVALDAAGTGGTMEPLDKILPHVDIYFPSLNEARHQTKLENPAEQIECYRQHGATGIVGVKLGSRGVILSEPVNKPKQIAAIVPPGPVVDTTGAGDSFFAGFMTGLLNELSPIDAARLGTAVGACSVTALGASSAIGNLADSKKLAGL
jgi:sugar/nucleoside kinase (ribokinase family)